MFIIFQKVNQFRQIFQQIEVRYFSNSRYYPKPGALKMHWVFYLFLSQYSKTGSLKIMHSQ